MSDPKKVERFYRECERLGYQPGVYPLVARTYWAKFVDTEPTKWSCGSAWLPLIADTHEAAERMARSVPVQRMRFVGLDDFPPETHK